MDIMTTFEIRCFKNKKRRLTHTLTKAEAKAFRLTAEHLIKYLDSEYLRKNK